MQNEKKIKPKFCLRRNRKLKKVTHLARKEKIVRGLRSRDRLKEKKNK